MILLKVIMVGDLPEITKFPPIFQFFSKTFEQSGDLFDFLPKALTFRYWLKIIYLFKDLNSSASRILKTILEIQKMKNCSEVPNFMEKMNFWSKCAEVSWLLRYSVFSVFTKISWPIFLSKLWKNWAGYNFFGDNPGFGLLHRFQKWSNFGKSIIQQLTYEQYAV